MKRNKEGISLIIFIIPSFILKKPKIQNDFFKIFFCVLKKAFYICTR